MGYEEINRSTKSGNSGWPLFIGPNAAYRQYDFVTGEIGASFDPRHPVNRSPNNTGLHELPPPFPALIWYPSEDSPEFPELGSGGRAAMLGFVYHFDSNLPSTTKLPLHFDRHLFIYDWCRNWVKAVELDAAGKVVTVRPFLDRVQFHRPIDVKPGPDGALYLLEYGDKWHDNVDSTLSRVVYYRGNRPPRADMTVTSNAGKAPLHVKFAGANSIDPDGDTLSYQWRFGDDHATAEGRDAEWIYRRHGVHTAALKVADAHGLSATAHMEIAVGNSPPQVRIAEPAAGGFFEWGETFAYEFAVEDDEDGSTASATIHGDSVQARWEYREDPQATDPEIQEGNPNGGSSRMRRSTCLSCHSVATRSIGPSLLDVSARYRGDPDAAARLTQKILNGGHGTWGEIPMPPHPQHSADEIQVMVDYVLGLRRAGTAPAVPGIRGTFRTAPAPIGLGGGAYVLTASYTDRGADGVPALTGEARTILHALRKRAMLFDESRGARILEVATLERRRHVCVQLAADSYISFKSVNLRGVNAVHCQVSASTGHGGVLEIRIDSPDGPLVGEAEIPVTGRWDIWKKVQAPLRDPGGVHDLYVVARKVAGGENRRFNLDILEFQRGSTAMAR
jgi:cytochrome c